MYNIVICDDDPLSVAQMENCLFNLMDQENYTFEIDSYLSGTKFLNQYLISKVKVDILFLDIEMSNHNGIEVARRIREENSDMIIIFFSSHEKYLIDLFEVMPFRFVSKPLKEDQVQKAMLSALEKLNRNHQFFEYTFKQNCYKLYLKDIVYFESDRRVVKIIGKQEEKMGSFYARLNDVEQSIKSDRFLRVHQSYLVNYDWIKVLNQKEITSFDNQIIQISEDRNKSVQKRYIQLARRESKLS